MVALVYLFTVGVGDVEAGGDGVVKVNVPIAGSCYQALKVICLLLCVQFSPVSSVFAIVFRSVDITGHPPRVHLLEQIFSLRESPGSPIEALHHSADEGSGAAMRNIWFWRPHRRHHHPTGGWSRTKTYLFYLKNLYNLEEANKYFLVVWKF